MKREGRFPASGGDEDANFPGLAIGTIAIREKYHDWCLSMIDSLRKRGNFQGPVYVVTENPEPFEALENVFVVKVPYTRYRLVAKSCKQLLVDWVHEPNMLFVDADVVIGKPLFDWYQRGLEKLAHRPVVLYTGNMPVPGAYHGGLMLLNRERARPFFQEWLKLIRTGRYLLDQQSLHCIARDEYTTRFDDDELVYLRKIIGPEQKALDLSEHGRLQSPAVFVHVTDGMIRKHSPHEIKTYLSQVVGLERMPSLFGLDA
ncbi:hypothetical protein [Salinisphaera sp.]|uniref:hypothetical protein n=1 Tax=Salinisphaera sp. TaxID=1914330 RepID=UPI000C628BE4|nr:hypothetical protein [Salinisphaera sp.]MAS09659.1 hypothetical protein [Salinisphaera sp.]